MITVSPTEDQIFAALRTFLVSVVTAGTDVIQAQDNRVPEPSGPDFVVMTPLRRPRLSTNVDDYVDCKFLGSIAGTVMTVTTVDIGSVEPSRMLFGVGVAAGTQITAQVTGPPGGPGTYTVAPSQTLGSGVLAAGSAAILQPTQIVVQLDVHGPNSADNAQVVSTLFRDQYGVDTIKAANADVAPLYCEDPRQVPFLNAAQQYENRWIIEASLQANQTVVGVPQQFADSLVVGIVEVEAAYPAS